ncbi:MAG: hypothetical protein JRD69_07575 [Deltaproteobacteria bacterium]|nr:hypothetical protein [Deltaproteobacteria bacterium]
MVRMVRCLDVSYDFPQLVADTAICVGTANIHDLIDLCLKNPRAAV